MPDNESEPDFSKARAYYEHAFDVQAVFVRCGLPPLTAQPLMTYRCVLCNRWHTEDESVYTSHLLINGRSELLQTGRYRWTPTL
jgi:hypothetical protein